MPDPSASSSRFSKEQKTGFVLLFLFALLTIGLGVLQLRNGVYGPFIARRVAAEKNAPAPLFMDEQTRLQQTDTDKDGITDYDEINYYGTSAYLPDTDSDGKTDKEEIDAGINPNCAAGTVCDTAEATPTSTNPEFIASPLNPDLDPERNTDPLAAFGQALTGGAQTTPDTFSQMLTDPSVLRGLLLQTGQITEEQLAQVTDEELLELAQELFAQAQQDVPSPQDDISEE